MMRFVFYTKGVKSPALRLLLLTLAVLLTATILAMGVVVLLAVIGITLGVATVVLGMAGMALLMAIPLILVKKLVMPGKSTGPLPAFPRVTVRRLPRLLPRR